MTTLLKPFQVRETLLQKGVRTFTPRDFELIFHTSAHRTKHFLEVQTEAGLFVRFKQGIYALKTDLPSEEEIANSLYKPSYISFEYALAYWGMMPEMPYTVTSATTKPTRLITTTTRSFGYYTIKQEAYTGYTLLKTNRQAGVKSGTGIGAFVMAEPEKALVDYLYFVAIGKRLGNDRLVSGKDMLDTKKLQTYAGLYQRKKLMELIQVFL